MDLDKLEKYFRALRGKSLSLEELPPELEELGESFHTNLVEAIRSEKYKAMGRDKTFNTVSSSDQVQPFAVLKSKKIYSKCEQQFKLMEIDQNIYTNTLLRASGAVVPKLYSMFYADNRYIEIQQLAQGKPIAYSNTKMLEQNALGYIPESFNNLSSSERQAISQELFNYNIAQQQTIMSLPDEAFDKLLDTFFIFSRMGFVFDDAHGGNVLVGDNGFTVIDMDYSEIMKDLRSGRAANNKEQETVESFIAPFTTATNHVLAVYLTDPQFLELKKNNVAIFKRLTETISRRGIVIDFNENKEKPWIRGILDRYRQAIGKKSFSLHHDEILESQIKLRESLKLPKLEVPTVLEADGEHVIKVNKKA